MQIGGWEKPSINCSLWVCIVFAGTCDSIWDSFLLSVCICLNLRELSAIQAALLLEPYDPAGPMVLEVAVAERDAVWSLWQVPTSELQHRPLGFGSKNLPSSMDNYSPFEKQLLAFCWALVGTKCLTMGHQMSTQPELPIINQALYDPPSHRVGRAQQYSIIKWKWYTRT